MPSTQQETHVADCPWFCPDWLLDHPGFPLATSVAEAELNEEE